MAHFTTFLSSLSVQEERGAGRGRTLEDPSRVSAPPKTLATIRLQEERGGGEGKNPGRSLQGQSPPKNSTIIGQ